MKIFLTAILITFSSLSIAKPSWQEATHDWENSPYLSSAPPFCSYLSQKIIVHPKYRNVNWTQKFGKSMLWGNHFCYNSVRIPICREYFGKNKIACLKYYSEGFTYWIKHSDPDFKLLPYLYSGYGDLLNEIGDTGQAIIQYKNSLKKNPRYIKAYNGLIDSYIKIGALKEAEEAVNRALKIKKTKSLVRKQQKINKLLSTH
jgi:tetratricopeptide (TPR) repeat protein